MRVVCATITRKISHWVRSGDRSREVRKKGHEVAVDMLQIIAFRIDDELLVKESGRAGRTGGGRGML